MKDKTEIQGHGDVRKTQMNTLMKVIDAILLKTSFDDVKEEYVQLHDMNVMTDDIRLKRYAAVIRKYTYEEMQTKLQKEVIVSITSFPKRIASVSESLKSIYTQTRKADRIILWLADEEFPGKVNDLPEALQQLVSENKLQVGWCTNTKPHKKYLGSMKKYPEALVITIDDDLSYQEDMIEMLFLSWLEYPEAVSALRTHIMILHEDGRPYLYNVWPKQTDYLQNRPSMHLFVTGGAGTLYPPHLIREEFLDEELIMRLCPTADDLWLKIAEILSDVPSVLAAPYQGLKYLPGTQQESLYKVNVTQGNNDTQMDKIIKWADETYGKGSIAGKLLHPVCGVDLNSYEQLKQLFIHERLSLFDRLTAANKRANEKDKQLKEARKENSELKKKIAELEKKAEEKEETGLFGFFRRK